MSDNQKICMLCGQLTKGSIGAAGIQWTRICQPCKDKEDNLLARGLRVMVQATDLILKSDNPKLFH